VIVVGEALAILERTIAAGETEEVSVSEGAGRVLAREIVSDVDWPPFDTSAMDGYAVRLSDVPAAGTALAERAGVVAAGAVPPSPLSPGESVRVMTGAPIPEGTEAIIPVEQAVRESGGVRFGEVPPAGAHIRRRGESVAAGTPLLPKGTRLLPAQVALCALSGADPVKVFRRPRITVAVTGDEVVAPSERPGPGQLRDSNGPMLLSLCRARGWPARARGPVRDEPDAVARLFAEAGNEEDFLITTGGVSAGDLDLLPELARRSRFEILFHRVAVRPGRPIACGRRGKTFWFGLPGNPVSASVAFHLFVRYALDRAEGDARPGASRVTARLAREARGGGSREVYRDCLVTSEEGGNRAEPLPSSGSHDLAAHARANALLRIPAGAGSLAAGSPVECLLLDA